MNRDILEEAGINYDAGVTRFGGQAPIYEKYLKRFLRNDAMQTLEAQIQEKDVSGAFDTSHALRGVVGNLSLDRLYAAAGALTELLRTGDPNADYTQAFLETKACYERTIAAIKGAE